MKYAFYTDDLHGWLKVSIEEIRQLGLLKEISVKSYVSNCHKYAFLEKDIDAKRFVIETIASGWFENLKVVGRYTNLYNSGPPSFIRNLNLLLVHSFLVKVYLQRQIMYFTFKLGIFKESLVRHLMDLFLVAYLHLIFFTAPTINQ